MAKVGAIIIYAMMLGPFLGGAITTYLDWRFIFIVNVPMGIFAIYYLYKYLPVLGELKKEPFDFRGFLLIAIALGSTLFFVDIIVHPSFTALEKSFI
jgi:DHA2 family multidrug resistance protein